MGLTYVTTRISNLTKNGKAYEADFLVDTGAIDCMVPQEHLLEAGIQPEGKAVYELANGQPVEYEFGFARVSFMGDETVSKVIFGPSNSEPLLGVTALESVGVVVDPVTKNLRRLPAKPLKHYSSDNQKDGNTLLRQGEQVNRSGASEGESRLITEAPYSSRSS